MDVKQLKTLLNVTTDEELGALFGRKGGAVSVWRKKGIPPSIKEKIEVIAPNCIFFEDATKTEAVSVPVYNAVGSCGPGAENGYTGVESWLSFTPEYARATFGTTGKGLCCIRASGDSMQPTINPGDMVILDRSENTLTRDGSVYVLQKGDTTIIKRLNVLMGRIRIASDNKDTGITEDMTQGEIDAEGLKIIGRVVFIGRLA